MHIKTIAIGNSKEAFIERNLNQKFNIIYSQDNNRGKTILIQSLMYALGNEPAFPTSFKYDSYDHIVEFECNNIHYLICRNKDGFYLNINKEKNLFFPRVTDLKKYINENIYFIPTIIKEHKSEKQIILVDPCLLFDIFFVGQDKKDTSKPNGSGYYNKKDCLKMLSGMYTQSIPPYSLRNYSSYQKLLNDAQKEIQIIEHKTELIRLNESRLALLNPTINEMEREKRLNEVRQIKNTLVKLATLKNKAFKERVFWQHTLQELKNLNKFSISGELICKRCASSNILYAIKHNMKKAELFDISTPELRKTFQNLIQNQLKRINSKILNIEKDFIIQQQLLNSKLSTKNESLFYLLSLKYSMNQIKNEIEQLKKLQNDIKNYKKLINDFDSFIKNTNKEIKQIEQQVTAVMNEIYNKIDPDGNNFYKNIFTTTKETYSGSEKIIYYLCKLYALQKILNHNFPIIVDSFRAEDLSSEKEERVLTLFSKLQNQIIFTTTLKDEETNKYSTYSFINSIDYTNNQPSKLLQPKYVQEYLHIRSHFNILEYQSNI